MKDKAMGVFSFAFVAIFHGIVIAPPERIFATKDMCVAAEIYTIDQLKTKGAEIISESCDLRQLAPMGK